MLEISTTKYPSIEPNILPLVNAINELGIVETFSSCQGHYTGQERQLIDKDKADVRFTGLDNISLDTIEYFITYLMTEFNYRYSFDPVILTAYKSYTPTMGSQDEYEVNFCFVIKIKPFDRFDEPDKKRTDTNLAILQATDIVNQYKVGFLSVVDNK